jgi:hypothetical protein
MWILVCANFTMTKMGRYWRNLSGKQTIQTLLAIGSRKALSNIRFFQGDAVIMWANHYFSEGFRYCCDYWRPVLLVTPMCSLIVCLWNYFQCHSCSVILSLILWHISQNISIIAPVRKTDPIMSPSNQYFAGATSSPWQNSSKVYNVEILHNIDLVYLN